MNYNTLRNKPTINHKELIGNNKASDIGGMTEEDMKQLLDTDLTPYYTKDQIDDLFSRSFVYREKSGSIVTFDCPSTSQTIPEVTAEIVAVQSGSGDPSPTNVRPFSGWSAVNRYRTGKNKIPVTCDTQTKQGVTYTVYKNEDSEVTRIHAQGTATANHSFSVVDGYNASNPFMLKAGSYWFKGISDGVSGQFDFNIRKQGESSDIVQITDKKSLELSEDTYFQSCYLYVYSGAIVDIDIYPMVWLKSEPNDDFAPYNGEVYTTQLKDGQGNPMTCYGGQLENVNGQQTLKDDYVFYTFTGNESGSTYGTGGFYLTTGIPVSITRMDGMCDIATMITTSANLENNQGVVANGSAGVGNVAFKFENVTTLTELKTLIAGHTVRLKRSTPVEIPQDNLSISSQSGVNNLWADTGDVTVKALDRIIQG